MFWNKSYMRLAHQLFSTKFNALFYCVGQYDMLPHPQWQTSKYWNVSKSERDFYLDKYLLFPWTVDFLIYIKVAFTVLSYLGIWPKQLTLKIGIMLSKNLKFRVGFEPEGHNMWTEIINSLTVYRRPIWKLIMCCNEHFSSSENPFDFLSFF